MNTDRRYHESAVRTLRALAKRGVRLDVQAGQIHYEIPRDLPADDVLEQIRFVKPHLLELLDDPETYRRAAPADQCEQCREMEAQGVSVLRCSDCDVRIEAE